METQYFILDPLEYTLCIDKTPEDLTKDNRDTDKDKVYGRNHKQDIQEMIHGDIL